MKGYYKDEEETKKVLNKDGWLNTGDRAYFTKENNLVLTGREKEIIVLSNGENINPAPLEDALSESEYISAAVVIGKDSWKNLALLILPNFDKIKEYYKNNKMTYDEDNPMLNFVDSITGKKIPEIEKLYSKAINELVNKNERFRSEEHIKHFEYIKELRPGEELTATLKIIRRKIAEVYHDTIEYMHQKIYGENKSLL
jgi:long-chain acyl-CoA synthetase